MKQIICEVCKGTDFIKRDDLFVCQSCGTKYTAEDIKKLTKDVTDPNFTAKLNIADEQAKKYFNYGPNSVSYGNIIGYDAVLRYYDDAWKISSTDPDLWLNVADFFIRGNIYGVKDGTRRLNNVQGFRDECINRLDRARKFAREKQGDDDDVIQYVTEVENKISELMNLLNDELPKTEKIQDERDKKQKEIEKKKKRKKIVTISITTVVAIALFVGFVSFISSTGSGNSANGGAYRCVKCGSTNVRAGQHNYSTGIQNFWCYDCKFTWAQYDNMGGYWSGRYEN